jgi:endoglucanase
LGWRSALAVLLTTAVGGHAAASAITPSQVLRESWKAYVSHFIQDDGRVVDFRAGAISTSEGQAYAMLRAVWLGDRVVFDKAYAWGRENLNAGVRQDRLWAWKWGKSPEGRWQVLDPAFASDADQDVALALILASEVWKDERYQKDARAILADLWRLGTYEAHGRRLLLAGDTLCSGHVCKLNPSYYAPYAYRVFAAYDKARNWQGLVDSSYFLLAQAAQATETGLPPDWLLFDKTTARFSLPEGKESAFSYDALRVHWRVAMDWELFREPRADRYLRRSVAWLATQWDRSGSVAAVISANGKNLVQYESAEMLAALMPAMRRIRPDIAAAMERKLSSAYSAGFWTDHAGEQPNYYLQNWAWFGIALHHQYLGPFRALNAARARPGGRRQPN